MKSHEPKNPDHLNGYEVSFKITTETLKNLKLEEVPDDILEKLKTIKDQKFIGEEEFIGILKATIGGEQTEKFKSLIFREVIEEENRIKTSERYRANRTLIRGHNQRVDVKAS